MKKITMLIIAAFIVITSAIAQTKDKVSKSIAWVYENGKWEVVQRNYPDNMYVVMVGNNITINTETDSRYITYGDSKKENTDSYESDSWDAYDEHSKKCKFSITKYFNTPGYCVFVIYEEEHVAVQYTIAGK